MATWHYPGPRKRGRKVRDGTDSRWRSLAWLAQLLAAVNFLLVILVRAPAIGDAIWWCLLLIACVLLAFVSILAVR